MAKSPPEVLPPALDDASLLRSPKVLAGIQKLLDDERARLAGRARELPELLKLANADVAELLDADESRLAISARARTQQKHIDDRDDHPERFRHMPPMAELEEPYEADDDPVPDAFERPQLERLLPPEVRLAPIAQGASMDPVTVYLSRYSSKHTRLALASSLGVAGRYLTGKKVDIRNVPWTQLRYAHVQALRAQLVPDYSWASVNRHLLAVRGVVKECWRLGLIAQDVYLRIAEVEPVRPTGREVGRALKPEEVKALMRACGGDAAGKRDRVAVMLACFAGLRRSEICDLPLENWKPEERELRILGKGNQWRNVYLNAENGAHITTWLDARGRAAGPLLCPVSKNGHLLPGKRLTSTGLYVVLRRIGDRAKIPAFTPHDLRRTFITRLLEKGVDALVVAKLAGHKSIQTTQTYDRRGEEAKKSAAVALLDDD